MIQKTLEIQDSVFKKRQREREEQIDERREVMVQLFIEASSEEDMQKIERWLLR